ncbi:BPSL0067 family protein [Burkholderia cenocepacia]|uniref:BPSL0067 family protein n=1 Tax=Burkholderia cenocepacia TaxID=95486 RepID=UPI0021AB307C|nr:BPSL0067 family protein [Burkholderia cenocepacia]
MKRRLNSSGKSWQAMVSASRWSRSILPSALPPSGDRSIRVGTVIATFENDRYPSRSHGNHAAFYLGQDVRGIHVVEQWRSLKAIQRRCIPFKGKDKNGRYIDPGNNADAFSVVK